MPYRLDPSAAPDQELCRAICEQVGGAIEALTAQAPPPAEAVHNARKHIKKARSALRLARKALGEVYDRENAALRDAAGRLSAMRDAVVMAQTLDHLIESTPELNDHKPTRHLRKILHQRAKETAPDTTGTRQDDRVTEAVRLLKESAERLDMLSIPDDGKLLPRHWRRTLRRAGKAVKQAEREPTDENLHTVRKRFKDYWYHTRLLRNFAPKRMRAGRKQAKTLTELLGEHHDLAVLRNAIATHQFSENDTAPLLNAIDHRQRSLANDIFKQSHALLKRSVSPKKLMA